MIQKLEPLTVDGTLEAIEPITEYVRQAALRAGLTEHERYYLCLAVDEIATNVVVHGYEEAGLSGNLTVQATFNEQQLLIDLEDSGVAFDPRTAAEPNLDQPPDERQIGGLGIYLALRSVDQFRYSRIKKRNRSTFIILR